MLETLALRRGSVLAPDSDGAVACIRAVALSWGKGMKILFSNPPGWIDCKDGIWSSWVRSGSRWPFSNRISSSPDCFISGDYLPAPLFLQFAASWCRRATGATVHFRDSIALRESYETLRAIL